MKLASAGIERLPGPDLVTIGFLKTLAGYIIELGDYRASAKSILLVTAWVEDRRAICPLPSVRPWRFFNCGSRIRGATENKEDLRSCRS